jgi:hypothetical protein
MIQFMTPARRGASDATRRRIVGNYLAERARRRFARQAAAPASPLDRALAQRAERERRRAADGRLPID